MALTLQAVNFWTATPTFNPIPKTVVGAVFLSLGVWLIVFLRVMPNLPMVRLGTLATAAAAGGWGFLNARQSMEGLASFQLPIWMGLIAAIAYFLLREAPVNPTTRKKE